MSTQAAIVPAIVQIVAECGVPAGLVLGGSVAEGRERDDSDVDFFAIVDAPRQPELPGFSVISEKNGSKVLEREGSGFPVHVACWTTSSMEEVLRARPYMMYPLLQGRILHGPDGIAQRYRSRMEQYFRAGPVIREAWEEQLRSLNVARFDPSAELAFPQWSDFVRHIESRFLEETAAPWDPRGR